MPKRIWYLTLTLGLFFAGVASSARIINVEYFFDSDPGYWLGTHVSFTGTDSISGTFFPVVPSNGFHVLYIRAVDDSARWGMATKMLLWGAAISSDPAPLTRLEYFFDSDPGIGNGTTAGLYDNDTLMRTITVNCTGLSLGYHELFLRLFDEFGKFSIPVKQPVFVMSTQLGGGTINAAECFFDTDPGRGNGTSIPVVSAGDSVSVSSIISLASVPYGFHTLFTRVRDSDLNWSIPTARAIWVQAEAVNVPNITAAEYFFDSDPGRGSGHSIPVAPGTPDTVSYTIDLSNVSFGFHTLYFRVKDNVNWGMPTSHLLWVQEYSSVVPPITGAEYFLDTDPGEGNGTPVTPQFTTSFTTDSTYFYATFPGVEQGGHFLFVRVRDSLGVWGPPQHTIINLIGPPPPPTLTVYRQGADAVLNWTPPPIGFVSYYRVWRDTTAYFNVPGTAGTLIATMDSTNFVYRDYNVGSHYYYKVTAGNNW